MLTFNYHQLHVLDYPILSANLFFVIQNKKKEPVTETNPQQALGLMKLYNVLSS